MLGKASRAATSGEGISGRETYTQHHHNPKSPALRTSVGTGRTGVVQCGAVLLPASGTEAISAAVQSDGATA